VRRVLIVSATAKRGGAERALGLLARRLRALGWEPLVALLERGPLEQWLEGIDVRHIPKDSQAVDTVADLASGFDVVLSNKWRSQLYGGPAAMQARLPNVWWQQDFPEASPAHLLDGSVRADAVVCSSDAVVEEQRRLAPWSRAVKIRLGIDVGAVAARRGSGLSLRSALGIAPSVPLIGVVGRIAPNKRQDLFLHAAAQVAEARPDVRFVVLGGDILGTEGAYAATLERLTRELGLDGRIIFAGDQEDAYAWIDALDVVAHPAERDPLPLVLIESLVLGKPVVAVDAGGPPEIAEHGVSGLLVPPGRPDALAAGILRAIADPTIARKARTQAEAFTDTRMACKFAAELDALVA